MKSPNDSVARIRCPHPGRLGPRSAFVIRTLVRPWVKLFFRPRLLNTDRLPDGPFLLVANHSAGLGIAEILSFIVLYSEQFGETKPIVGFAHPFAFKFPFLSRIMRGVGAIPSTYPHAFQCLNRGLPLLIFPGGDHEVSRPFWQAKRVDFNGRQGFLKIAQQTQIQIVPMGISGSHMTVPILWRSTRVLPTLLIIPRLFGVKRFPLSALGLLGLIAIAYFGWTHLGWWTVVLGYVWMISLLSFVPVIPSKVVLNIGHALPASTLFDDQSLDDAYDMVVSEVQALVDNIR